MLLVAAYWRTNLTIRQLAAPFGTSKSAVSRIIDDLRPKLALRPRKRFPPETVLIVDGTPVPTRDHIVAAKSKNYRFSPNHQVVIHADTKIVVAVIPVLRSLMAEAQRDADFRRRFQDGFLTKRRAALETIVDRATARGDKPVHLTAALAADVVFGLIWYRVLATERLLEDDDITAIRRLLTDQLGKE